MEPRAAVAEWDGEHLTVWTGCDGPSARRRSWPRRSGARASVRVVVPDMGGGFGGKHSAEAALEAARLARSARQAGVGAVTTQREEFAWAYCRPAALVECRGGLSGTGALVAWEFTSINPGGAALATPYAIPNTRVSSVGTDSPLRQGSYDTPGRHGQQLRARVLHG